MQLKHLLVAGLASTVSAQTASLVQALNATSDLSGLLGLVASQQGLATALSSLTNVTILAPNNAAITALMNATNGTLTNATIAAVLQYHILNGTYSNFSSMPQFIPTSLTNPQYANVTGGQRVELANGNAYSGLRANSTVNATALNFTGGVVHVINKVLTIPSPVGQTLTAFNLTSAYGALNATNLLGTVTNLRDATFFIPNNAAFQAIGGSLANLSTTQITSILQYHVLNQTVYSSQLGNTSVPTLAGGNITITVRNATTVFVNGARVVQPDILVAGGVVHVVDAVLNPSSTSSANATQSTGVPQFSGASSATNEPYTSGQPLPTSSINTGAIQSMATATSSSSTGGAWSPKATGAIGAAAMGGLALLLQL